MHLASRAKRAYVFQLLCVILAVIFIMGLTFQAERKAYILRYWIAVLALLFFLPWRWLRYLTRPVLKDWWKLDRGESRRLLSTAFFSTLAFTLAAHGFLFANEFFSHDSLFQMRYGGEVYFYYGLGRFIIPPYETLKGEYYAPWLVGVLFLFWSFAATVLVVHLFGIRGIFGRTVTAGLLCTNTVLTLTGASYIYCMDEYALAMLLAVASAWFFCRCHYGELLGIFCLIMSLGLYQSYFTLAPALCLISLIYELLSNENPLSVIMKGLRYLILCAVAFGLYYVLWHHLCRTNGLTVRRTDESLLGSGLSGLLGYLKETNEHFFKFFLTDSGYMGALSYAAGLLLVLLAAFWLIGWLLHRDISFTNKLLLVIAVGLLPTALNSADLLLLGKALVLSVYGRELVYVCLLLSAKWAPFPRLAKRNGVLVMALLLVFLWQNIVFANHAYIKKELDKGATLSVFTRVIDRLEETEGYIPGETPAAIVGSLDFNTIISRERTGFQHLHGKGAVSSNYSVTYAMETYPDRYLNYPMIWNTSTDFASMEEVQNMPIFPAAGCTRMIDGTAVIRLS